MSHKDAQKPQDVRELREVQATKEEANRDVLSVFCSLFSVTFAPFCGHETSAGRHLTISGHALCLRLDFADDRKAIPRTIRVKLQIEPYEPIQRKFSI